ncbi:MAG TPA: DUF1634 domain-containing protein [Acidobacteriaceae bacterium]|nr:DUF1634 domain-containing protein [Acidobacteriaceae bacterium]
MAHQTFVPSADDTALDERIGAVLRIGTLSSAFVILLGGILYLARHTHDHPSYHTFRGVSPQLHTLSGIVAGAAHGHSLAIIQLGLLMLIATPIARVILSVFAFLAQRDFLYVVISGIVLVVLLYSLFWH